MPLPPSLQFSTVQADTVQVEWSEPFTWEAYPITGYSLTVNVSETEDTAVLTRAPLISSKLSPDTHNYSLTNLTAPTCTNLTFSLQAISHVGNSLPGIVFGALPESKLLTYYPAISICETNMTVTWHNLHTCLYSTQSLECSWNHQEVKSLLLETRLLYFVSTSPCVL